MNMAIDIMVTLFTVAFALIVVFSKKTVVSALSLLMTLMCISLVYFLLGSNFLSAVQVLVNAGAIAILFVFVMMLINLEQVKKTYEKSKIKLILATFSMLVAMGVLTLIINNNLELLGTDNLKDNSMTLLFSKLFDSYYLPFELATMLLLGSIVAVVVLTSNHKQQTED